MPLSGQRRTESRSSDADSRHKHGARTRFVRWLHDLEPQAPENGRRFANMVLNDFDAIAETAPQRNAPSAHLTVLARRVPAATSAEVPNPAALVQVDE